MARYKTTDPDQGVKGGQRRENNGQNGRGVT